MRNQLLIVDPDRRDRRRDRSREAGSDLRAIGLTLDRLRETTMPSDPRMKRIRRRRRHRVSACARLLERPAHPHHLSVRDRHDRVRRPRRTARPVGDSARRRSRVARQHCDRRRYAVERPPETPQRRSFTVIASTQTNPDRESCDAASWSSPGSHRESETTSGRSAHPLSTAGEFSRSQLGNSDDR